VYKRQEFAHIKKDNYLIGDGERACMAVARFGKDIIASSNFRDVAPYCNVNNIHYLGTLDILTIAFQKGLYSEGQCDAFIQTAIKQNKARFPKGVTSIRFYETRVLSFLD
jgi:predicted nucleic acid-binding protein